jgi:hypothetical protein
MYGVIHPVYFIGRRRCVEGSRLVGEAHRGGRIGGVKEDSKINFAIAMNK